MDDDDEDMTDASRESLGSKNKWMLVVALLLVVPGALLSVVFAAIGLGLLLMLFVDFFLVWTLKSPRSRPSLGIAAQLGLVGLMAATVGGVIAFVAFLI